MKKELIQKLHKSFEDCAHTTDEGVEFWLARELQELLGYTQWRNFEAVIDKAQTACRNAGQAAVAILLTSAKWSNSAPRRSAPWRNWHSPATPAT